MTRIAQCSPLLVHAVAAGREELHQNESRQVLVHAVAAEREELYQNGGVTR